MVLRRIQIQDAEELLGYRSLEEVYRFQGWKPSGLDDARDFITNRTAQEFDKPNTWYQFGIYLKDSEQLIGDIGVHFKEPDGKQVELGYTLSPLYQGHGYATEAVRLIVDYLFREMGKHKITGSVDPLNEKSMALLERLGMRREAHFKKSYWNGSCWCDDVLYEIRCEEWRWRKPRQET